MTGEGVLSREVETGAPGALARAVESLAARVDVRTIDRMWVFPPSVNGRSERGLVAISRIAPHDPDRRVLVTALYTAELTGRGLEFEVELDEHGEAGPDHLSRVMEGFVRRGGAPGDPRELSLAGSEERLRELREELE